jgi:hypothetical protein
MKTVATGLLFVCGWFGAFALLGAFRADPELGLTADPLDGYVVTHEQEAQPHLLAIEHHVLAGYLEEAGLTWLELPTRQHGRDEFLKAEGETVGEVRSRVREVAEQVAEVLMDGWFVRGDNFSTWELEPPVEDAHAIPTGMRVPMTGLVLMSLAFHEGRFRQYVDKGWCNDPVWRKSAEGIRMMRAGPCDGGHAYTIFQIHPERGVHLYWDWHGTRAGMYSGIHEWGFDPSKEGDEVIFSGEELIEDRSRAVVTALHMVRQALRSGTGLCRYSGEIYLHTWDDGVGCPKAEERMRLATEYAASHPY